MSIRVGDCATREFVADEAAMRAFQALSGDQSRIHCDEAYAKSRGYDGVIVYGGIMLAHLSHLLGMKIPGTNGTSLAWTIKYHKPLYVGEKAAIELTVVNVSPATGVVESKFTIKTGDKRIASGTAQSIVPSETLAD
jgi:acyl dehydratase